MFRHQIYVEVFPVGMFSKLDQKHYKDILLVAIERFLKQSSVVEQFGVFVPRLRYGSFGKSSWFSVLDMFGENNVDVKRLSSNIEFYFNRIIDLGVVLYPIGSVEIKQVQSLNKTRS